MKISLCSIGFRRTAQPLSDIIPIVADLGFDGIEIWGEHIKDTEPCEIASTLADSGLEASMISPYFDFTGPTAVREKSVADADVFIDYAAAINAPLIRVFTGVVGSLEADRGQFDACAASLREVCDKAAASGVGMALETHPKTLVDTVPGSLTLLEAVDRPNLKLNLDIYHLWEVHFDPVAVLEWLFEHIGHVHAKNAKIQPNSHYPLLHDQQASQDIIGVTPMAEGNMPYTGFLKSLKRKGFNGYVSVEWFGPDVEKTAAGELAYLRDIFNGR